MKKIPYIIIIVLIAIIILQKQCHKPCPPPRITIVYDSVPVFIKIPEYIPYETIIPGENTTETIYKYYTDSAKLRALIIEHYAKNMYNRVLVNDSSLYARIVDTVFANKLCQGQLFYLNRRATKIISNTTIVQPKRMFFIGGSIGGNKEMLDNAGISLLLTTNKNSAYAIGNNFLIKQPNLQFTMYWRIGEK